ncbi:MAG: hypothetical protein GX321_10715 [Clostridiales bacterium]|nr:hypothetical protein [Clostridiales bacterium]
MKYNLGKKVAITLVLALLLTPLLLLQGESDAYAATPTFKETSIEIIGEDETYQLDIKDKVADSKYKWSSSNTKVARVSSKGVVTSVGKGTANIKCKITYPSKKTKTLTCKVTVVIPATKVKINNANEINGAHILQLGETYNFNRDITPSNSSDKTYWSIGGGDPDCITITNTSSGIVEARKPGKVILKATAARTATEEEASLSIVNDAIIIEVVGPSATVNTAEIIDSTVIEVLFDSPIDASTVIGANGTLADSIAISPRTNIKGVSAADPGRLSAELSADKKTLTITSANRFDGDYMISFTSKIKTTDGVAIEDYNKQLRYEDNKPPFIEDYELDDSGMSFTIKFNEAIDFSGLKVSNAGVLHGSSSTKIDPITESFILNKNNYVASEDKRSLSINLSNIAYSDFNKVLTVTISGIKDMAGNLPANYTLTAYLRTDNTPKPQARLINVIRTGYNTLTADFDRSIQMGGVLLVTNGSSAVGIVDEKDPKKVHYTITEADAQKTGLQTVSVSGWRSYNVDPTDTTSYQQHTRTVNFDIDRTSPMLIDYDFDGATGILTLTYNKEVNLVMNTGVFNATLVTVNDEIIPNNNINYVKLSSDNPMVIKLKLSNMTLYGNYTFTLSKYLIADNFKNYSIDRVITINNVSGVDLELPGPHTVKQSPNNPSQIYLEFDNRLDVASAQDIRNYTIPGVTIIDAKVKKNTNDNGATVVLTVAEGTIDITIERPVRVHGVGSYSGIYTPITLHESIVLLKDNKKPTFIPPAIYDKSKPNEIRLTFSEEITGTMRVKVTQMGGTFNYEIANTIVSASGKEVIIPLNNLPVNNSYLRIDILENKIADLSGNQVEAMNSQLGVVAQY